MQVIHHLKCAQHVAAQGKFRRMLFFEMTALGVLFGVALIVLTRFFREILILDMLVLWLRVKGGKARLVSLDEEE